LVNHWLACGSILDSFRIREKFQLANNRCTACTQAYGQPPNSLLSDAEAAENDAEKVIGCEFSGDLTERLLRQTEFLGKKFEGREGAFNDTSSGSDVFLGIGQGAQMALAGNEYVFRLVPAGDPQQLLTQQFNAFAGTGRQGDSYATRLVMSFGLGARQIDLVVDRDAL
jgi:hypothetical protein